MNNQRTIAAQQAEDSRTTFKGYSAINHIERYETLFFIDADGIIYQSDKVALPNDYFAQPHTIAWHIVPCLPRLAEFVGNYTAHTR